MGSGCGVRDGGGGSAHWRPHKERFVVINVLQGHLQRLHGLIWHWLTQVTGYQDELGDRGTQSEGGSSTPPHSPGSQLTTQAGILF